MILAVAISDYVAKLTGGFWELLASGAPTTPTLSVTNDGDGDAVTATVAGDDGATHTVYYQADDATAWTSGGFVVGDGEVAISGLTNAKRYSFLAVGATAGVYSLPSPVVRLTVTTTADSWIERVALAVLAKLQELIAEGHAVAVERPLRAGVGTNPRHKLIVLYQDDPDEDETPHGFKSWVQPFLIDCYLKPADSSTTAVDAAVNEFRSRVEAKLREDPELGGLSTDLRIRAPLGFQTLEGAFEGIRVIADVMYRTLEDDPYSQT